MEGAQEAGPTPALRLQQPRCCCPGATQHALRMQGAWPSPSLSRVDCIEPAAQTGLWRAEAMEAPKALKQNLRSKLIGGREIF